MSGAARGRVHVHADARAAAAAVAEELASLAAQAVEARGRFSLALAGGSTPRALYRLLAEEPHRSRVPWHGVHLFWGDERCVPPGHPRSNFRMVREALVSRVPLPEENVHRVRGELSADLAADDYAHELRAFFGGEPRFDVVHLGLGDDGHTASLFPFSPALRVRGRPAARALQPGTGEPRVTLTVPALNGARRVDFLVTGAGKARVVGRVVRGALDPFRLPAQLVRPRDGELHWHLDVPAAAGLDPSGG